MDDHSQRIVDRLTLKGGVKNSMEEDLLIHARMCVKALRGVGRDNPVFMTGSGGFRGVVARYENRLQAIECQKSELLAALTALLEHAETPDCTHEVQLEVLGKPGWVECQHCYAEFMRGQPPVDAAIAKARAVVQAHNGTAPSQMVA